MQIFRLLKMEDEYSNFKLFVFRNQKTKFTIAFMWAISVNGLSQARTKLRNKDNKKAGASQPPKDYRTELYSASCRLGKLDF